MRISKQWLQDWVNVDASLDELIQRLTMAGLEVDGIEDAARFFSGVTIGSILSAEKIPQSDHLQLCQVNVGSKTLEIVCGASNARKGLHVACAVPGSVLPSGLEILPRKVGGHESQGMLCSWEELGLADNSEGIIEFSNQAPVGTAVWEYLQLTDQVLEIDLTPNRADCLSIQGMAREISALTAGNLHPPVPQITSAKKLNAASIEIDIQSDFCTHYCGRIVRGVHAAATTPEWMAERLRRCGIRSIHAIVDITNYVMLELGQPMHAFNLAEVENGIVVRRSSADEALTLLDTTTRILPAGTPVIANKNGVVVAIAGVMGGLDSSVTLETKDIFFEAAHFVPLKLAGVARSFGLHTESSHRFERGVDPQLPLMAIQRATELLIEIAGGEPEAIIQIEKITFSPVSIELTRSHVERILGLSINADQIQQFLSALGFQLKQTSNDIWNVTVPSWRFDVEIAEDLIEEIARMYGYDNLPITHFAHRVDLPTKDDSTINQINAIKSIFVDLGYREAINYAFCAAELDQKLSLPASPQLPIDLTNPISQELSRMRSSLWPGLINNVIRNQSRGAQHIALFECGTVFSYFDNHKAISEEPHVAGVVVGKTQDGTFYKNKAIDFFDVKGDLEIVLDRLAIGTWCLESYPHSALHPGQSAAIIIHDRPSGWIGRLDPKLSNQLGIEGSVYLFEIKQAALETRTQTPFVAASKFPAVKRDLAFVISEKITAEEMITTFQQEGDSILKKVQIFDVFRGGHIATGSKSVAFSLLFQSMEKTLEEAEINQQVALLISAVQNKFGAQLRDR